MFSKVAGIIIILLTGFFLYVAMKPSEMLISRELLIKASPDTIFPYINSAKKCNEWMPWAEVDPKVQISYSGPDEGVGTTSSWTSTGRMGEGKSVVVESIPNQVVKTQLTYTKPMEMTQLSIMSLTPKDGGTLVRWSVSGKNAFVGRLMCVFMNMDKEVGGQFEKGLAKLKLMTEK